MADLVKKLIQFADKVTRINEVCSFKQECTEIQSKIEVLSLLLRKLADVVSRNSYDHPVRLIMKNTEQVLLRAQSLILKCGTRSLMKRVFTIIPSSSFLKMSVQLQDSILNVSWLLRFTIPKKDVGDQCLLEQVVYPPVPPIARNERCLCLIWQDVSVLYTASLNDRSDALSSLVALARKNNRCRELIIQEGGVRALLKLIKVGTLQEQEKAALVIGLLQTYGRECSEQMIQADVSSVFVQILKEGPMKVQATVAWAVSELASNDLKWQQMFAQHNIVPLLLSHLAFEYVLDYSIYGSVRKVTSMHPVVME